MHMCPCVSCMHACLLAQVEMYGNHRSTSDLFSTLVFKTGYLTESGARCLAQTGWSLGEPQGPTGLHAPALGKHGTMLDFLHRYRGSKLKLFPTKPFLQPLSLQFLIRTADLLCFASPVLHLTHHNSVLVWVLLLSCLLRRKVAHREDK